MPKVLTATFGAANAAAQIVRGTIIFTQVRKTPSWPRSWSNFSHLSLYSHMNAWAN
jgi:hypothetical protein